MSAGIATSSARGMAEGRKWSHVAFGGLLAMLGGLVATSVVIGEVIPPLVVMGAIIGVLAVVSRRWGAKRGVAFMVAAMAALFVAANVRFVMEDLQHPESFFSFFPTVVLLGAAGVVAVAGFASGMRMSTGAIVPGLTAVGLLVAAGFGFSLVKTLGVEDDTRQAGDLLVTAKSTDFPEAIEASAGTFGIYLENDDRMRHTFVIRGQDIKQEMPGSTSRRFEVTLPAGTYEFYCDVPGHSGVMEGVLTVK